MNSLVNGEARDSLPLADRGLSYGDGLFETVFIKNGRPRFWPKHLQRLQNGCAALGIAPPAAVTLRQEIAQLFADGGDGVLKIIVTRGSGGRGYYSDTSLAPTRILTRHTLPAYPTAYWQDGIAARLCQTSLSCQPRLAGIKHLNRLEQVLARREWADGPWVEGLMLDAAGRVIEGIMSNVFLVQGEQISTPNLDRCGVQGIMRGQVLEMLSAAGRPVRIRAVAQEELWTADELFVTNSLIGIWPVKSLDARQVYRTTVVKTLQRMLGQVLQHNDESVV